MRKFRNMGGCSFLEFSRKKKGRRSMWLVKKKRKKRFLFAFMGLGSQACDFSSPLHLPLSILFLSLNLIQSTYILVYHTCHLPYITLWCITGSSVWGENKVKRLDKAQTHLVGLMKGAPSSWNSNAVRFGPCSTHITPKNVRIL